MNVPTNIGNNSTIQKQMNQSKIRKQETSGRWEENEEEKIESQ